MPRVNAIARRLRCALSRRRLKNRDFSLFASNCVGACICHDLGLPFRSPFVNLWLRPADLVKLLEAPKEYLEKPLEFFADPGRDYPVAKLGDLTVYFQHYKSEEEAAAAWKRRCGRIHWDNLFVLMTDQEGCDEALLRRFDKLPYPNKAVLTHLPYADIPSAVYIPGFEDKSSVGNCVEFVNRWSGKRYYDYFDYVKWLNEGK